jgi:hypothetical protein
MKRIIGLALCMACSTPKSDTASELDGGADGTVDDGGASTDGGSSDEDADGGVDADDGSSDADDGSSDADDGSSDADDGSSDADSDADADDGSSDADDGSSDADDGSSDADDGGGGPAVECTLDALDFDVRVEDGDGPCASPCDKNDDLTYYASVSNGSLVDCFIETSSSCLVRDIEIIVSGPHGGTMETYWPSCDDAITERTISAGGSVEESVDGGKLNYGTYVVQANFDVESSLAYGTTSITVD